MRDTPDPETVRDMLSSFYSRARYQFVGDEVIGFFVLPDHPADFVQQAMAAARALVSIGESVSQDWQRRIDRMQSSGGVHVGLTIGDVQVMSLGPFFRTHIGAIGDCINVVARLMTVARAGEAADHHGCWGGRWIDPCRLVRQVKQFHR